MRRDIGHGAAAHASSPRDLRIFCKDVKIGLCTLDTEVSEHCVVHGGIKDSEAQSAGGFHSYRYEHQIASFHFSSISGNNPDPQAIKELEDEAAEGMRKYLEETKAQSTAAAVETAM